MRTISYQNIVDKVSELCINANYNLGQDVVNAFKEAVKKESSEIGRDVLNQLITNAEIAASERVPMCQDTGVAVFIVEVGQDIYIEGGTLNDAINEGVKRGYRDGYLRNSIVSHPLERKNTGDNTPAIIHIEFVPGNQLKIMMTAKGGGAENMSRMKMLKPSDGIEGVKDFIIETVRNAGPNACPPLVVGVGIGGNFEYCSYLAKKALFREVGKRSNRAEISALEVELLEEMNQLGIGPQGYGGSTTALDVKIEIAACHIAALPVAVNLNCHASRHKEAVL